MSAHTPGPWIIRKGDEWTRDVVTDHGEMPDGSRNYWNVASANIRREECIDNLRLIAASPDLLEALQELIGVAGLLAPTCLGDEGLKENCLDRARAAIAKATGGEA